MSRRTRKQKWPVVSIAWRAEFAQLFEPLDVLIGEDWTPPASLRTYHGARHYTVVAFFRNAAGHRVKFTSRITRGA